MKTLTPSLLPSPSNSNSSSLLRRAMPWTVVGAATCALFLSACTPQDLTGEEPATDEQGFLSTAVTPKGTSLRALGFSAASLDASGQPMFLSGRIPAAIQSGADVRAFLVQNLGQSFRLTSGTDFAVASAAPVVDELGHRYYKMNQTYAGVPIARGEVVVQVAEDGAVIAVAGRPLPGLRVNTTAQLSGDKALGIALDRIAPGAATRKVHEAPALRIYTDESGHAALAYRAVIEYFGQKGRALEEIFVDANSGDVLAQHSRIHTGLSREIYDVKKKCLQTGDEIPGTLLFKEAGSGTDTTAKAAYDNTGLTYWFYKNFFNRDSYDGAGAKLVSSVHVQFGGGAGCDGDNAAWLGAPYNQMVYGDGDTSVFKPLAGALDVTAHELTHAVTNLTSDLTYSNESGALNEAMSDILGSTAEAWQAAGGSAAGNPATLNATAKTWLLGEDVARAGLAGGALRFMDNPTKDNYSTDYYPERITGSDDNGGVHGNSGIANLAFYLLSQGGKHPRGKTTTTVTGIGLPKAAKIFFTANTTLFTSSTNFQAARTATAQAAKNLYGDCSAEWTNTHKAWDAVGVLGSWTACGGGTDTTAPTASLTGPTSGTSLSGTVTLTATATDNIGVASVEFYRGTALIGSDSTSPYSVSWDTTGVADGSYTLTVKAKDAAGNVGTSSAVTVSVKNGGGTGSTSQDEAEPNGSFSQANAVSASGTTVTGYISSTSDKDYFKVVLPLGKTLTATLTPPATSDFDVYIYDNGQNLVSKSEKDVGLVDSAQATNSGTPITYWVVVRYYSGASTTSPYKLKLSW